MKIYIQKIIFLSIFLPIFILLNEGELFIYGYRLYDKNTLIVFPLSLILIFFILIYCTIKELFKDFLNYKINLILILTSLIFFTLKIFKSPILIIFSYVFLKNIKYFNKSIRDKDIRLAYLINSFIGITSICIGIFEIKYTPGDLIPGLLNIYNFEQYYAASFLILYSSLFRFYKDKIHIGLFDFLILLFICIGTENKTALIISIFIFINFILYVRFGEELYKNSLSNLLIIILFTIIYPFAIYLLINLNVIQIEDSSNSGLLQRFEIIYYFIDNLNLFHPYYGSPIELYMGKQAHNQFISWYILGGIPLLIFAYIFYLSILSKVNIMDRFLLGSSFLTYGLFAEIFEHPFLLIQFLLLLSLKFRSNNP